MAMSEELVKADSRIRPRQGFWMARSVARAVPRERPKRTMSPARYPPGLGHVAVGRGRVQKGALPADAALGSAVFPVVEDEDLDPRQVMEQLDILQAVADVAGVAVEPHQDRGPGLRHPPAVELDAVRGLKEDVLVFQPEIRRGADEIRVGEEDDAFFGIFQDHE